MLTNRDICIKHARAIERYAHKDVKVNYLNLAPLNHFLSGPSSNQSLRDSRKGGETRSALHTSPPHHRTQSIGCKSSKFSGGKTPRYTAFLFE